MDKIWTLLLSLYIIVGEIMAVIFFIDYVKTDESLLKIILLDPILAEIKGLLWIFFI